ncbi:MAG: response regulator transcription factor [Anaerolineae bacterium]|nr:response regulator transcription factor [Anaerolineae bacterium]
MPRMRVLIIDEHDAVRQALQDRLAANIDVEVVGCTACWQEGLNLAAEKKPDVILLETKRSDGQGMTALHQLRAQFPAVCILILTSYPEPEEREKALEGGAAGYLLKDIGSARLLQEIRAAVLPLAPI